jgi:DNA-binding CsgD family transcriptional regulator
MVETRLSRELRRRANRNVMAMTDADENGWVDTLLRDLADAPLLRDERGAVFGRRSELTPAELRVIGAMSHGLTAGMAADLFTVSPETIKRQLKAARFRLQAKNTAHAVANAIRRGDIK